jgi:hypothetical protein
MEVPIIGELAKLGMLGVLLAIALYAIVNLKGELTKSFAERISDWKANSELIGAQRQILAELVSTTEARTRAQEAMARAQELSVAQLQANTAEVARLREVVDRMAGETQKLREQTISTRRDA